MKLINNRYKLLDVLKKDVYGTTFIAEDLSNKNMKILLNTIDMENNDKRFIEFLINNFMLISSINHMYIQKCNNFNVINTIDNKNTTDFQYFYTVEYMEEHLENYRNVSKHEANNILVKLCYALSFLHFRGITYKFLNFKNIVIVDNKGEIDHKLRDLVSMYQHNENISSVGEEHAQFIAPEIKLGEKGNPSSDIYSIGVIYFYLISGLDYKKNNFNEVFKKNDNDYLYEFIEKMTASDLNCRYKNIMDVIENIKEYLSVDYDFFDKEYYEKLNFNIPLVNRVKEKNITLELINEKLSGKSKNSFIFIHGEAGIGKSRFVKEINFQVSMNKTHVCSVELASENNRTFDIYKKILGFIVKHNKVGSDLIDKYGSELVKILPDLAPMWNVKPSETLIEDKEILRLNNRIYNFISEFTTKNPLVITIDNIHYAHKNDLNILEHLVRNTKDSFLVIICTYTDEESNEISELLRKLKKEINTRFIQLSKLNFEETAIMLKNILGMNHKPLKLTTKIMEETAGNPRYVEEIVKSLFMDKQIIINEKRLWIADIDDIYNLKLPSSIDDAKLMSIRSLDLETRKVLDNISIFHSPVSLEIITKMIDMEQSTIIKVLINLVGLRIINENFEDWGYSYDYYDKHIKKFIYSNIKKQEKKVYHLDAANILEEFYICEGRDYAVELVYHFASCGAYDKSIEYCIKAAEKMKQLHIYNQAIVFYNRAIEFLKNYDDTKTLIDILMKMGDIYVLIGQLNNAFKVYSRVVEISKSNGLQNHLIDAKNKLAYIHFYRNEIDTAQKLLEESIAASKELKYVEGELEGALIQFKLSALNKTHQNMNYLLDKYIKISLKYLKYNYTGEFFNEKGKLCFDKGEMTRAQYCYEQSIFYFEKANENIKTTSPLNNIGLVYLEAYKNIKKAREYYNKALQLFEKYNYITDREIFLMNIGETYLYEDKYSDAINYFNKAVEISLETGDMSILFCSYIHLCDTYLNLYQYDKAYFYLKKLEDDFQNYNRHDMYHYDYYLIHIKFYNKIHSYSLSDKWYNDFLNIIRDKRVDFDLEKKILELKINRIQYDFYISKLVNVEEIKNFLLDNVDKVHPKLMRKVLINLAYTLIIKDQVDDARYFIDLDESLIGKFNTEILDVTRSFALGLFNDNKIEYYKELLNRLKIKELYEYEWRIFKILGDEYYERDDYYNALSNYITSLDILKSLTNRIPEKLRESYIFDYDINCIVKQRIEDLKGKILSREKDVECRVKTIKAKRCLEEFFDFSDLNTFFRNKVFMESVYKESREELSAHTTDLKDIIQNLKKDELYNIQLILKYCFSLCLAERGFVFIINEHNEIQEIISAGKHEANQEVKDILKNVNKTRQDIIITNLSQFKSKDFKHNEIKSLICIPIMDPDKENLVESISNQKRKLENKSYSKEIAGYLYLDTKRVLNNFTYETYEKCYSLINLLYVMIQNYGLKKLSSIDKLTNLYLRKHIEDLFRREILFSQRNELKLSVVMCDIDRFKHVNDFYGHQKGDEVLANIGEIFKNNLRKTDLVGRYGGEEFIIILPDTDGQDAFKVCEKLRKTIEDSKTLGNESLLTMSFGISSYPKHGRSEDELIEKADQALYKSKKSGRNRITIWNKDIGYDKLRYDKLAGIITGDISTDHRNVNCIIDIIELLKNSKPKSDKLFEALGYLIEISGSKYGAIFEMKDNMIRNIYARERANNTWLEDFKFNEILIKEFIDKKQGDFFIDWNDVSKTDKFTGIPNWNSFIVVHLINGDIQKGVLLLSVPISEKEFDFSSFNLVNSLSGVVTSML